MDDEKTGQGKQTAAEEVGKKSANNESWVYIIKDH